MKREVNKAAKQPKVARARDSERTRADVLKAAETLFCAKGREGVRLREVADAAGVSQPLLIHHFGDKDALYREVVQRAIARVTQVAVLRTAEAPGAFAQFESIVREISSVIRGEPQSIALIHRDLVDGGDVVRESVNDAVLKIRRKLTRTLQEAQKQGDLRPDMDVDILLLDLVGALLYPVLAAPVVRALWKMDPMHADSIERHERHLMALLPAVFVRQK
ncbi:MAG: TetR/AcrR family transcriptional regulator [Myxococcaceae bacterium]